MLSDERTAVSETRTTVSSARVVYRAWPIRHRVTAPGAELAVATGVDAQR